MSLDPKGATTLIDVMRRRTALTPDVQYFSLFDETVTYARLWAQSARYAAGFAAAGVRPGDKVCLIYPTCAEFFYTFLGAMRLGAVPVPLYPTLGVEGTAGIFRDSEAVAVATIGWFRAGVDASVALAPGMRLVLEPNELDSDAPAPPACRPTCRGRRSRPPTTAASIPPARPSSSSTPAVTTTITGRATRSIA